MLEEVGILMHKNRVYVPNSHELRKMVLKEMYTVPYARHLDYHNTIATVRSQYVWLGMKKGVFYYIDRSMEFQIVTFHHRHPTILIQWLPIPEWKWEVVTIDCITKFPRITKQHDSILVVLDKLTKDAHLCM